MLHTLTAIKKKLLRGPKSHFWSESCSEGGLKYTWVLMRESLPRVWDGDNLLYILNPHPSQVQWWIREGTGSLKAWVISPSLWVTQSLPHPAQRGSCRGKKKKQGEREIWPSQLKWNFCKLFSFTYFSSVMRVIFGARRSQKDVFVLSATKHRGNRKTSERTFTFKMFEVI